MASLRGRERSLTKFLFAQHTMAEKARPKRVARLVAAEHRRQDRHIPGSFDPLEVLRGEFLLDFLTGQMLGATHMQGAHSFMIPWRPYTPIANGPHIEPFAHIFDRFVHGCWTVRVVDNIDGSGAPGWLFERG